MSERREAAERLRQMRDGDDMLDVYPSSTYPQGDYETDLEEIRDAYLAIADLITPEVLEAAEIVKPFPAPTGAIGRLYDFAIAVIEKLEAE